MLNQPLDVDYTALQEVFGSSNWESAFNTAEAGVDGRVVNGVDDAVEDGVSMDADLAASRARSWFLCNANSSLILSNSLLIHVICDYEVLWVRHFSVRDQV
ncbi:hypothetical protein MRB53_041696 [Persea americana]|nr:hypothetical protein MRB53_041696 [Persea americana]